MSHMFEGLMQMRELYLSLETKSVKDISYMFRNCDYMNKIDFSNFETESVEDMSHIFEGCTKLISLDLGFYYKKCEKYVIYV